jgi:hypothetical protein
MAFQVTVERDWKSKLHADAEKVKAKLGLAHMTLVTSRRVPEADFEAEADDVWRRYAVRATKLDSQAIASTFFREGRTTEVLSTLGIELTEPAVGSDATARTDAAYSFVFFGKDTHHFRDAAIESAIVTVAARHGQPWDRRSLETGARSVLQMPEAQRTRVRAVVDRLIQAGSLSGPEASLSLSPQLADAAKAMRVIRQQEWDVLRKQVARALEAGAGTKPVDVTVEAVLEDLGALLLDAAHSADGSLASRDPQVFGHQLKRQLRHLHATLDTTGVADGPRRDRTIEELANLASNSPVGKCLLAGELFLCLTVSKAPQLIRALGARSEVRVLLDASVAIPMLAALLFRPVDSGFLLAAHHAYSQLRGHGMSVLIPVDYLEEAATHLMRAYADYGHVVDMDVDLTASENAYIAHYATLRREGDSLSFEEYLQSFGLDEALHRADFYVARDAIKPRLQRLFDRYSVDVLPLGQPSPAAQRKAEEALAYAIRELDVARPDVLTRHDARTLAYLYDRDRRMDIAYVLCTWDGLQFKAREREAGEWLALNPAVLGDILAMAAPEDLSGAIRSPVVLAKGLSEEAAERGARVWDHLVVIERGKMHDAKLLALAAAFKHEYIQRAQAGQQAEEIRKAWAGWKATHYSESGRAG